MSDKDFVFSFAKNMIILKIFGGVFVVGFFIVLVFGLFFYQSYLNNTSAKKIDDYNMYPDDYKYYALDKVEELYDKDTFSYNGYYQKYSSNEICLEFLFNKTMSENKYKKKIKENTEKIYNELKDRYIVKQHVSDSKDISIGFSYYIPYEKSTSKKKCIWSYTIFYINAFDKGNWPAIESDYSLDLE